MDNDLFVALITISDILREEYGLTIEESATCINNYRNFLLINDNKAAIEVFLHTSYKTWAKRMYEDYNQIKLKRNK